MSTLEVNKITPISGGTTVTLGDSGDTFNLASGATAGFGKIGQVVNATTTTQVQSTSGTFTDSTIVASITPSSTSSKIIINIQMFCQLFGNSVDSNVTGKYQIVRTIGGSATNLFTSNNNPRFSTFDSNTDFFMFNFPIVHVDSPNTTSACEYKIQIASGAGTGNSRFSAQQDSQESNIVLMEVLP